MIFLPAIVTIILFVLGYWVNQQREIAKSYDILEGWEEYFFVLATKLVGAGNSQVEEIESFLKKLEIESEHDFDFKQTLDTIVNLFDSIPHIELYKIFVDRKNGEIVENINKFNAFYDSYFQLKAIRRNLEDHFLLFGKSSESLWNSWNIALRDLVKYKDKLLSQSIAGSVPIDPFLKEVIKIVGDAVRKDDTNINVINGELLEPLLECCRKYLSDPRSIMLMGLRGECYNFGQLYLKEQKYYHTLFSTYKIQVQDFTNGIEKAVKILSGSETMRPLPIVDWFMTKKGAAIQRLRGRTDFM